MKLFVNSMMVVGMMLPIIHVASVMAESSETQPSAEESTLEEVMVFGSHKDSSTVITEDAQKLMEMPGALGDPLGAISALPGVISPASGGAPAVRGSSPSDNRFYVDGIPAGYIFHRFNTSIFDENVVRDFRLFSAGFGAQYSNATGAVFDIRLRDPKNQPLETTINTSILRTGLFLEGGISENSAFYLSIREGMLQYVLSEQDEPEDNGIRIVDPPADGDYQFKYLWDAGASNRVTLSLTGANDAAQADFTEYSKMAAQNPDFSGLAELDQSFDSQGLTWERELQYGGNLAMTIARYEDGTRTQWGQDYFQNIVFKNVLLKSRYSVPLFQRHLVTVGLDANQYDFDYDTRTINFLCTEFDSSCQDGRGGLVNDSRLIRVKENTAYLIDNWQLAETLNVEIGIQSNYNDYTSETFIHPRIALEWQVRDGYILTSSAGRYNRFPDVETVLPLLGNPNLASPTANHYTLGIKNDASYVWNWSVEAYYKILQSLPLALTGGDEDGLQNYSNDVAGKARGLDLMINRNQQDRWYGWIALSYSTSERTNLRSNETRNYVFDTPVVFNMVGNYEFNERWTAGFHFSAKSGEAETDIVGVRDNPDFPGHYLPIYGEAFADRLPNYTRLDFRAERTIRGWGKQASFYIDVINALNTNNIVGRNLDYEKVDSTGELHIEKVKDRGILPSIGFSITF